MGGWDRLADWLAGRVSDWSRLGEGDPEILPEILPEIIPGIFPEILAENFLGVFFRKLSWGVSQGTSWQIPVGGSARGAGLGQQEVALAEVVLIFALALGTDLKC